MVSRWRVVLIGLAMTIGSGTAQAALRTEVVPAGTMLNVRLSHPIYARHSFVGMRVPAFVDNPLFDRGGNKVVPRGSPATLEVVDVRRASNTRGRDRIFLKVESVRVGRRSYAVATNHIEVVGRSEGRRTARNVARGAVGGAAVGGMIGGGTGAAVGAATGGTTGAIVSGSGRRNTAVGPETRLQFRLAAPVRIRR
jgi:hypothetical protein